MAEHISYVQKRCGGDNGTECVQTTHIWYMDVRCFVFKIERCALFHFPTFMLRPYTKLIIFSNSKTLFHCKIVFSFMTFWKKLTVMLWNLFSISWCGKGSKSQQLGCLYVPHFSTKKYGLNSITRKCINGWNSFSKIFNCSLKNMSKFTLKSKITQYFINTY